MFSVNIGTYFALTIDFGYSLEAPEYSSNQSIVELRTAKMIISQDCKNDNQSKCKTDMFSYFSLNIYCGYSLEPPGCFY